jgi:putative transposase
VRYCEQSGDRTGSSEAVREMVTRGLSERRALTVVHMSAAALRYVPRPDPDSSLHDRIVALAHRHRRYGAGMIYLNLRQEGRVVNHKRVDRLYVERVCRSDAGGARRCPWPIGSR